MGRESDEERRVSTQHEQTMPCETTLVYRESLLWYLEEWDDSLLINKIVLRDCKATKVKST